MDEIIGDAILVILGLRFIVMTMPNVPLPALLKCNWP